MKRPIFALIVVIVAAVSAFSQTPTPRTGFITGRVTETSTGQPVAAKISVAGRGETKSDEKGDFRLEITPGVYSIQISADGFAPVVINSIDVTGGRDTVVNPMLVVTLTADVEVRSEIFAQNTDQTVSNVTLRREELRTTPGTAGDPLRAINSQPAVTSASAEFADLIVRGGTPDENLTLVDNIPVRDFTYFSDQYDGQRGGRASILAPDVFDRAEFSAGGYGARYGDKMSSVLDIGIRSANRRRVQGVMFADSGTMGGSLDVPLGRFGSWMFSARRSYIDIALDVAGIADAGIIGYPRTLDFTNKFLFDLSPKNKLTITALDFIETFNQTNAQALNIDRRTDRFRMRRTSKRHTSGATLTTSISNKTLAQTTAWANINHNDGAFYLPNSNFLQRSRDLRDSEFGVREHVSTMLNRNATLTFGGGISFDSSDYYTFENTSTTYSPLEEEYRAPLRQNRLKLDTVGSGFAYAQAAFSIGKRFMLTPGIRLDHYGLTGETLVSPRFAARFNVLPKLALTFATGIYRQPPGLFQYSLVPANQNLNAQSATHIIGGVDWLIREDIRVRFEAFRKSYSDLIMVPLAPTPAYVWNGQYTNTGTGTAKGFEISVQRALTGFLTGQASYGYIRSERSITPNGPKFISDLERPHQLTLIGITGFYGFVVAAKFRLANGLPYTRRTAITASPGVFIQRIVNAADINALRFTTFASLDLRAERRFTYKRISISPYIDIFNVTNHRTVVQTNYEFNRRNPQLFSENQRFPIFGFRFEF